MGDPLTLTNAKKALSGAQVETPGCNRRGCVNRTCGIWFTDTDSKPCGVARSNRGHAFVIRRIGVLSRQDH